MSRVSLQKRYDLEAALREKCRSVMLHPFSPEGRRTGMRGSRLAEQAATPESPLPSGETEYARFGVGANDRERIDASSGCQAL